MSISARRLACALWLLALTVAPALGQSTRDEWLALRARKQARHHRLPGPTTEANAFTITIIRFFSDPAGNLVGVGEARNGTSFDLSYSRINFRFLDTNGHELGREWTYLHGGITAHLITNNANESLLIPGAIGFFKIWTTIPAAAMASYSIESAGEKQPYAKPQASLGTADSRPERWAPLVYLTGHGRPIVDQRLFAGVLNEDPQGPGCLGCGNPNVFATSLQVSVAAYRNGVIEDVQSVAVAGRAPTARCTEPPITGISLRDSAAFTLNFARPADVVGSHAVEWQENETRAVASPSVFIFDEFGGEGTFTINRWCGESATSDSPWLKVVEAASTGPGAARIAFAVDRNTARTTRRGIVSFAGIPVSILQASACPAFPPRTAWIGGGPVSDLPVADIDGDCLFGSTLSSSASWLSFGINTGTELRIWAEPNFTGGTRTAVVTLGRQLVTIHQSPASRSLDFDRDGTLDLLWHHRDGWIAAWHMNGLHIRAGALLSWSQVPDADWAPVAATDFEQNSAPDVVWRHRPTGRLEVWELAGTDVVRNYAIFPWPDSPDWKLRSAADFNRDGRPDFVWQHDGTGAIDVSGSLQSGQWFRSPLGPGAVADLDWKIVASGDFNRDGWPDLVWQHQGDGRIAVWKMQQTAVLETTLISPGVVADLNWKIRAVGDMNGDDLPDLIWQHRVDGRVAVWVMNGTTMTMGVVIAQVPDTGWEIVGPR